MEKEQRNRLQKATQDARRLLEEEFRSQLLQTYDIDVENVRWSEEPGAHLQAEQRLIREKLVAWIEHKEAQIHDRKEALLLALREMAFTALNRFVALKLMEARELVRPCVSGGLESAGFLEFTAVAQGLLADQESSYRLYLETIFEDVIRELRALFDPLDPASLLWPRRGALLQLVEVLNRQELSDLWNEDETLGWFYQFFNSKEERQQMRDQSATPQNSRELAVRNQFFTPRYVVQFLADNTLGRLWYEMRHGETALREHCIYLSRRPNENWLSPGEKFPKESAAEEDFSHADLLKRTQHVVHRPLKDPREIRMLDPACGSMHFGLYAFDLFELIYREAWELEEQVGPDALIRESSLDPLHATYTSKAEFETDVPRLILAHNIHGVDIDPRAVQISGLTLWLRAHKRWQQQGLEVGRRPSVRRAQVTCAEPMPGEETLLCELLEHEFNVEERPLFKYLLEKIFQSMSLAGEAGSLLKIEEEIQAAIAEARGLAREHAHPIQTALFSELEPPSQGELDLGSFNKAGFWHQLEERIFEALRSYANYARSRSDFRQRIFADDTAEGFAFIDVLTKEYDVILMNPPFGEKTSRCASYFQERFPRTCVDFYAMFYERSLSLLNPRGKVGAISNRTWLGLPTFTDLRTQVFGASGCIEIAADLGSFVLDAQVETVALVAGRDFLPEQQALWVRLLKTKAKQSQLISAVHALPKGDLPNFCFLASQRELASLPSGVYGYWMSDRLINLYQPEFSIDQRGTDVKVGTQTSDDFRFLRLAWEIPPDRLGIGKEWARFAKGGEYQNFFDDIHLVIRWAFNGKEIASFPPARHQNASFNGMPGVTWPRRTTSPFGPRAFPAGCVFGDKGPVAFPPSDINPSLLLGFLAAKPTKLLLSVRLGAGDDAPGSASKSYEVGLIRDLPFPEFNRAAEALQCSTDEATELVRSLAVEDDETTALFCLPAIASSVDNRDLRTAAELVIDKRERALAQLARLTAHIDSLVAEALCFADPDREVLWEELEPPLVGYSIDHDAPVELFAQAYLTKQAIPGDLLPGGTDAETDVRVQTRRKQQVALRSFESICRLFEIHPDRFLELRRELGLIRQEDLYSLTASLVSYCIGCAFGRWDIRLATGSRSAPNPPDPFASLPSCAPGQLQDEAGLPVQPEQIDADYPLPIAWDGVLVTDPGHPLDVMVKVRQVLTVLFPGREDEIAQEASSLLGISKLDDYIQGVGQFFADHLKTYSKSRRQAPICWQLASGSGSYAIWLYYHRLTADTIFRVLNEILQVRLPEAERDVYESQQDLASGGASDAAERLLKNQQLLQDIRQLSSELELVAPLWMPVLDDGVIINHAILWRITPYTPWQKKCKECWDKLVKGDYDWAHLAFHLWPERVIPKCTTDRSLAIAHGLEERLWQETNNGNWLPRQLSEADLQALISEHSNPAIKSALERFLAAPPPVAPTRTRASRGTRASGSSTPRRARGSAAVVDAEATRQVLLALTAAPSDGLAKTAIADLIGVEANALTAVIKQLKESGQIDQLGERRGARYVLSEQGRAAVAADAGGDA